MPCLSEKNRTRYRTVAFRMSEEEWTELNERVALSGRQKQEFCIQSCLTQRLVVIGNRVQFKRLEATLTRIADTLEQLESASDLDTATLAPLRTAVEIIRGFREDDKIS